MIKKPWRALATFAYGVFVLFTLTLSYRPGTPIPVEIAVWTTAELVFLTAFYFAVIRGFIEED